jgi:tRNA nucleotidyltransferase (CCA-adding enzyme)
MGCGKAGLRARDLMEPLCVVAGASESVGAAATRLRSHQCGAAAAVLDGRAIGLLTSARAEDALRHGAARIRVADLVCGGAPRVGPGASLPAMARASRGTAPGLLVGRPGGPLLGVISRNRVGPSAGRDLRKRLEAVLGPQRSALLRGAGALARARGVGLCLVGGVVRDLLLGMRSADLDLVVEGDGIAFAEDLARSLGARLIRHEMFGTAAVVLHPDSAPPHAGLRIDVASARSETYDHAASLPRVAPGSLLDDLARRDVTINSMAVRLEGPRYGRLIDEMGGERDLRRRVLRVHHALSLLEDPTRAYRVARFAARFGFEPSDETLSSLELASRLGAFEALGGERLHREFGLITHEPDPAAALAWCAKLGLLSPLGPGLRWNVGVRRWVSRLHSGLRSGLLGMRRGRAHPALMTLMLLSLDARADQRRALAARLRIRGEAADLIGSSGAALKDLLRSLARGAPPSRIVRLCEGVEPEILAIAWAAGPPSVASAVDLYFNRLRGIRPSVTGETLRMMGLRPGPRYAEILSKLRWALLDGRVRGEAEEMRLVRRLSGGRAALTPEADD